MKGFRRLFVATSVVVMSFISCTQDLVEPLRGFDVYEASVEAVGGVSRVEIGEQNTVVWSHEDCITIFEGSDTGKKYQVQPSFVGKTSGEFKYVEGSDVHGSGLSFAGAVAVYPYGESLSLDILEDETYQVDGVDFPAFQMYSETSFSNGSFPMTALSAYDSNSLSFKNAGGVLKLKLTGDYKVSKITLTGNTNEHIAGGAIIKIGENGLPYVEMSEDASKSVTLICDPAVQLNLDESTSFYISLPPTDFVNGFKVIIDDSEGNHYVKATSVRNVIRRSKILVMPEISPMPMTPFCETGSASGITMTSAVVACSYENLPETAEYGIRITWDGGERNIPLNVGEGSHNVEITGLTPGTLYSYWAYVQYGDNSILGNKMEFNTEAMDMLGMWTCVETNNSGVETAYTIVLLENGHAVLNKSNEYESAVWSCNGSRLEIKFSTTGTYTYSYLKLKVDIDDSCVHGSGLANYGSGTAYSGSDKNYDVVMTKNQDMCMTGSVSNLTMVSATLSSYYSNIPAGGESGIILYDGYTETEYSASGNDGSYDFVIADLEPGTTYFFWAYVKYDGRFIMGEVREFTTSPIDAVGVWTCVETYSSGTTKTYTVILNDDGTASIHGEYSYSDGSWHCKGKELTVSFAHYTSYSGQGLDLVVNLDVYSIPFYGTGSAITWAENWNTGGSSQNYKDLRMTKNEQICSTGTVEDITVVSAIINCSYSNVPSGSRCGVVVKIDEEDIPFYADGIDGNQSIEIQGLEPGTVYSYWAFVESDNIYAIGDVREFTTESMDVVGTWLCKEMNSENTEYYSFDLNENGTVTISKDGYNYESSNWSCKGKELHIYIAIINGGSDTYTYVNDCFVIKIEDPFDPVYGIGKATKEVYNSNSLGTATFVRDIEMTKQK